MPIDFTAEMKKLQQEEKQLEADLRAAGNWFDEDMIRQQLIHNHEAQTAIKFAGNRGPAPSWGQNTRIIAALKRKGIRSLMYNAAQECGAYASDPFKAMVYEREDLVITLFFHSCDAAIKMQNAALSLTQPPISIPSALVEADDPTRVTRDVGVVKRVLGKHYDPKATTAAQPTLDCLMSETDAPPGDESIVSLCDDLLIHQSIENPNHPTLRLLRPVKCHIVSKMQGGRSDSSNYLVLWRVMHHLLDGILTPTIGVPEIMIELDKNVADQPLSITPPRTKVALIIKARTEVAALAVVDLLKDGTRRLDATTFSTSVNILNDDVTAFKSHVKEKALTTSKIWCAIEGDDRYPATVQL